VGPRISRDTVRRILREGKVSWQTTTIWKASTDPDFIAKMHRILALYDTPPADGRWLNWIESEFAALRYFAPESPIRQWTEYPAKAA
jgi:hypothetical protein